MPPDLDLHDLHNLGSGSLTLGNIIASVIFSGIGFVAFRYGKSTSQFNLVILGAVLMAFSYFTPTTAWTYVVGTILTAAIYFVRE